MAVVGSNYRFTLIDVGAEGRQSDTGVFKASSIGEALSQGALELPDMKQLPGSNFVAPYTFIGDEALQLRTNFLRPFLAKDLDDEKRIFNYRLSRAR